MLVFSGIGAHQIITTYSSSLPENRDGRLGRKLWSTEQPGKQRTVIQVDCPESYYSLLLFILLVVVSN